MENMKAAVEALLFAMGDSVSPEDIASAIYYKENNKKDISPETASDDDKDPDTNEKKGATKSQIKEIKSVLEDMISDYEDDETRGIRLIRVEDKYQLCTKPIYYDELSSLVNVPHKHSLTDVLLETLSIIAYKQPITRQQIEQIRGVSCSHAVNKLIEYKLICEVGRLDGPGRPILFGTTEDFLRAFGISSMEDLPEISADKIMDFKKQAEEEAGITLDT